MIRESEIDECLPVILRVLGVRLYKGQVVINGIYLPHNVVPGHDPAEHAIKGRQTGAQFGLELSHN